ncbi:hypothetical protein [Mucilaginibacter sp. 10I4]|uniref:hypothetical protein n=1 Tax=Mucilaginibacter sp. 10I4 TaxID=3048580 RepID=UPI002B23962A|nr:hypothetical protein [Mucilaginibacter sp. 10I4]MEB0262871.1 hypothetical protein [Mucilaginibacter sp. 10I4]
MIIKPNNTEIKVDVEGDYQPFERQTLEHSGCGESFYPTSVKHNDVEIINYLTDSMLEEIELKFLKGDY